MANLASSAVSLLRRFVRKEPPRLQSKRLRLALSGQGGTTNKIPASALGFKEIISASNAFDDTNGLVYPTAISSDGQTLYLCDDIGSGGGVGDVTLSAGVVVGLEGVPV